MPPQTPQEIEDAIAKRFGALPPIPSTQTPQEIEDAIANRFGALPPKPRTEAEAIKERFDKKMGRAPASPDTFAGQYEAGINPGLIDLAKGLVTHPIDTVRGALGSLTGAEGVPAFERDLQAIWNQPGARTENILSAIQHAAGMLPFGIGSQINRTGDLLRDTSKPLSELIGPALGSEAATLTNLALVPAGESAAKAYAAGAPARAAATQAGREAAYVKLMKQAFPDMDAAQVKTTMPHMAAEHAVTPIATVEDLVAAKDSAIRKIETHVQSAVDHFPNEIVQVPLRDIEHALDVGGPGPTPNAPPVRGMGTRATDIEKGMKAIETLGLDQPMTLPDLYDRLLRLNSELRKTLSETKYDVAAMRQSDPVFRALELGAEHARQIIYERLDQLGVPDIQKLRADEGALIETRGSAYNKRLQGDTAVRAPGTAGIGQRILAQLVKQGATIGGAFTGSIFGTPGAVSLGAVAREGGEVAANAITRGPKPRNVVIERATRNLEGQPAVQFPALPGQRPTVTVMPPGGPGGPPAGPGLPTGPPPTGVGFPRWQPSGPGPRSTVTVLPPEGPAGLPPGTPPLGLPPAPPRQLGPAVREMPAGNEAPDFRAPTIPDQVLPTTWEELKRFYQGEDISRGTGQQPNLINDILSLPPEERALAIAELERGTPPAGPPDTYTPPERPVPPSTPAAPSTPAPPPTTPPAVSPPPQAATSATPATGTDLVGQLRGSLMKTGVSDIPVADWRARFAEATPEALEAMAAHLRGPNSTSWATKVLLPEVNQALNMAESSLGEAAVAAPVAPAKSFKTGRPTARVLTPLSDADWNALEQQNALSSTGDARGTPVPADAQSSVPAGDTPFAERPDRRASVPGGGASGAPKTGVEAIPPSLAEHFEGLLADARQQGFEGTPDDLATEYRLAIEKAKDVARQLADDSYLNDHSDLLTEISRAGGLGMEADTGMRGEIRTMLESLTKGSKLIRRGAQAGKNRYMPRPVAGLPGAPGILRMKGGLSADRMLEHLQQHPQFEHRWQGLSEFLEEVNHAIQEATGQRARPDAKLYDLKSILEGALDVRPGEKWWTPF
jgi:hypothetical protein